MRYALAGDVGGTKANLALVEVEGDARTLVREEALRTGAHGSLEALVRTFLGNEAPELAAACLGVAGPVKKGRVEAPNLPWIVTEQELARATGVGSASVINDLLANAYGIDELGPDRLAVLNGGVEHPEGSAALLAAGTGLGQACLFWDGTRRVPVPSEGGHADFAPTDELQMELLRHLNGRFGRTSVERVLSGPGLHNIYRFLVETERAEESPEIRERMAEGDPPAVIAEAGLAGEDPVCVRALDVFARVYGAEAGNLALRTLATAGVYVGGGIAPKILDKLRDGAFLEAFGRKGRLSSLVREVPVRVILDPKTALYGAARRAAEALVEA